MRVVMMKLFTVLLLLKTADIAHAQTQEVWSCVVVALVHTKEQLLNSDVKLTSVDSKPYDMNAFNLIFYVFFYRFERFEAKNASAVIL